MGGEAEWDFDVPTHDARPQVLSFLLLAGSRQNVVPPAAEFFIGLRRRPSFLPYSCILNRSPFSFHPCFSFFNGFHWGKFISFFVRTKKETNQRKKTAGQSCSALLRFAMADGLKLASLRQSSHNSRHHSPPHPFGPAGLRMAGELNGILTFVREKRSLRRSDREVSHYYEEKWCRLRRIL